MIAPLPIQPATPPGLESPANSPRMPEPLSDISTIFHAIVKGPVQQEVRQEFLVFAHTTLQEHLVHENSNQSFSPEQISAFCLSFHVSQELPEPLAFITSLYIANFLRAGILAKKLYAEPSPQEIQHVKELRDTSTVKNFTPQDIVYFCEGKLGMQANQQDGSHLINDKHLKQVILHNENLYKTPNPELRLTFERRISPIKTFKKNLIALKKVVSEWITQSSPPLPPPPLDLSQVASLTPDLDGTPSSGPPSPTSTSASAPVVTGTEGGSPQLPTSLPPFPPPPAPQSMHTARSTPPPPPQPQVVIPSPPLPSASAPVSTGLEGRSSPTPTVLPPPPAPPPPIPPPLTPAAAAPTTIGLESGSPTLTPTQQTRDPASISAPPPPPTALPPPAVQTAAPPAVETHLEELKTSSENQNCAPNAILHAMYYGLIPTSKINRFLGYFKAFHEDNLPDNETQYNDRKDPVPPINFAEGIDQVTNYFYSIGNPLERERIFGPAMRSYMAHCLRNEQHFLQLIATLAPDDQNLENLDNPWQGTEFSTQELMLFCETQLGVRLNLKAREGESFTDFESSPEHIAGEPYTHELNILFAPKNPDSSQTPNHFSLLVEIGEDTGADDYGVCRQIHLDVITEHNKHYQDAPQEAAEGTAEARYYAELRKIRDDMRTWIARQSPANPDEQGVPAPPPMPLLPVPPPAVQTAAPALTTTEPVGGSPQLPPSLPPFPPPPAPPMPLLPLPIMLIPPAAQPAAGVPIPPPPALIPPPPPLPMPLPHTPPMPRPLPSVLPAPPRQTRATSLARFVQPPPPARRPPFPPYKEDTSSSFQSLCLIHHFLNIWAPSFISNMKKMQEALTSLKRKPPKKLKDQAFLSRYLEFLDKLITASATLFQRPVPETATLAGLEEEINHLLQDLSKPQYIQFRNALGDLTAQTRRFHNWIESNAEVLTTIEHTETVPEDASRNARQVQTTITLLEELRDWHAQPFQTTPRFQLSLQDIQKTIHKPPDSTVVKQAQLQNLKIALISLAGDSIPVMPDLKEETLVPNLESLQPYIHETIQNASNAGPGPVLIKQGDVFFVFALSKIEADGSPIYELRQLTNKQSTDLFIELQELIRATETDRFPTPEEPAVLIPLSGSTELFELINKVDNPFASALDPLIQQEMNFAREANRRQAEEELKDKKERLKQACASGLIPQYMCDFLESIVPVYKRNPDGTLILDGEQPIPVYEKNENGTDDDLTKPKFQSHLEQFSIAERGEKRQDELARFLEHCPELQSKVESLFRASKLEIEETLHSWGFHELAEHAKELKEYFYLDQIRKRSQDLYNYIKKCLDAGLIDLGSTIRRGRKKLSTLAVIRAIPTNINEMSPVELKYYLQDLIRLTERGQENPNHKLLQELRSYSGLTLSSDQPEIRVQKPVSVGTSSTPGSDSAPDSDEFQELEKLTCGFYKRMHKLQIVLEKFQKRLSEMLAQDAKKADQSVESVKTQIQSIQQNIAIYQVQLRTLDTNLQKLNAELITGTPPIFPIKRSESINERKAKIKRLQEIFKRSAPPASKTAFESVCSTLDRPEYQLALAQFAETATKIEHFPRLNIALRELLKKQEFTSESIFDIAATNSIDYESRVSELYDTLQDEVIAQDEAATISRHSTLDEDGEDNAERLLSHRQSSLQQFWDKVYETYSKTRLIKQFLENKKRLFTEQGLPKNHPLFAKLKSYLDLLTKLESIFLPNYSCRHYVSLYEEKIGEELAAANEIMEHFRAEQQQEILEKFAIQAPSLAEFLEELSKDPVGGAYFYKLLQIPGVTSGKLLTDISSIDDAFTTEFQNLHLNILRTTTQVVDHPLVDDPYRIDRISFVTKQQLETLYPDIEAKERSEYFSQIRSEAVELSSLPLFLKEFLLSKHPSGELNCERITPDTWRNLRRHASAVEKLIASKSFGRISGSALINILFNNFGIDFTPLETYEADARLKLGRQLKGLYHVYQSLSFPPVLRDYIRDHRVIVTYDKHAPNARFKHSEDAINDIAAFIGATPAPVELRHNQKSPKKPKTAQKPSKPIPLLQRLRDKNVSYLDVQEYSFLFRQKLQSIGFSEEQAKEAFDQMVESDKETPALSDVLKEKQEDYLIRRIILALRQGEFRKVLNHLDTLLELAKQRDLAHIGSEEQSEEPKNPTELLIQILRRNKEQLAGNSAKIRSQSMEACACYSIENTKILVDKLIELLDPEASNFSQVQCLRDAISAVWSVAPIPLAVPASPSISVTATPAPPSRPLSLVSATRKRFLEDWPGEHPAQFEAPPSRSEPQRLNPTQKKLANTIQFGTDDYHDLNEPLTRETIAPIFVEIAQQYNSVGTNVESNKTKFDLHVFGSTTDATTLASTLQKFQTQPPGFEELDEFLLDTQRKALDSRSEVRTIGERKVRIFPPRSAEDKQKYPVTTIAEITGGCGVDSARAVLEILRQHYKRPDGKLASGAQQAISSIVQALQHFQGNMARLNEEYDEEFDTSRVNRTTLAKLRIDQSTLENQLAQAKKDEQDLLKQRSQLVAQYKQIMASPNRSQGEAIMSQIDALEQPIRKSKQSQTEYSSALQKTKKAIESAVKLVAKSNARLTEIFTVAHEELGAFNSALANLLTQPPTQVFALNDIESSRLAIQQISGFLRIMSFRENYCTIRPEEGPSSATPPNFVIDYCQQMTFAPTALDPDSDSLWRNFEQQTWFKNLRSIYGEKWWKNFWMEHLDLLQRLSPTAAERNTPNPSNALHNFRAKTNAEGKIVPGSYDSFNGAGITEPYKIQAYQTQSEIRALSGEEILLPTSRDQDIEEAKQKGTRQNHEQLFSIPNVLAALQERCTLLYGPGTENETFKKEEFLPTPIQDGKDGTIEVIILHQTLVGFTDWWAKSKTLLSFKRDANAQVREFLARNPLYRCKETGEILTEEAKSRDQRINPEHTYQRVKVNLQESNNCFNVARWFTSKRAGKADGGIQSSYALIAEFVKRLREFQDRLLPSKDCAAAQPNLKIVIDFLTNQPNTGDVRTAVRWLSKYFDRDNKSKIEGEQPPLCPLNVDLGKDFAIKLQWAVKLQSALRPSSRNSEEIAIASAGLSGSCRVGGCCSNLDRGLLVATEVAHQKAYYDEYGEILPYSATQKEKEQYQAFIRKSDFTLDHRENNALMRSGSTSPADKGMHPWQWIPLIGKSLYRKARTAARSLAMLGKGMHTEEINFKEDQEQIAYKAERKKKDKQERIITVTEYCADTHHGYGLASWLGWRWWRKHSVPSQDTAAGRSAPGNQPPSKTPSPVIPPALPKIPAAPPPLPLTHTPALQTTASYESGSRWNPHVFGSMDAPRASSSSPPPEPDDGRGLGKNPSEEDILGPSLPV